MRMETDQIQHIARLVRLSLTEQEIDRFRDDLSRILESFSVMRRADITEALPLTHPASLVNVFRSDEPGALLCAGGEQKLRAIFPDQENRFLRVQTILQRYGEE